MIHQNKHRGSQGGDVDDTKRLKKKFLKIFIYFSVLLIQESVLNNKICSEINMPLFCFENTFHKTSCQCRRPEKHDIVKETTEFKKQMNKCYIINTHISMCARIVGVNWEIKRVA